MHALISGFLADERATYIAITIITGGILILLIALMAARVQVSRLRGTVHAVEGHLATEVAEKATASAKLGELEKTYGAIIDVDREIEARRQAWSTQEETLKAETLTLESQVFVLRASYAAKRETYDRLHHEVAGLEDRLDMADLGMYRPVISLGSTAEYKAAIENIREQQKAMISEKRAIVCTTSWTVEGSQAKGRTMINRNIRLILRAYNNECEVLINKASWKNYESIRNRMLKCRQTFDSLNESLNIFITDAYEKLKLKELQLVYEEAFKHQEEKDRLREEREREREEAKAQRELQAEIARSEKREREREAALAEARSELAAATDAERAKYQGRVAELEEQLAKAHAQTERTRSMAEQTRIGHVYIISNVGAFGEEVFKIGMTRRLEPLDRIRELGDASVPFPFEVHALIFTEDAPTLERELHAAMEDARMNRVNLRKEFFRASGSRVAEIVRARFPSVVYVEHPESQEYLGSLSAQELQSAAEIQQDNSLPMAI